MTRTRTHYDNLKVSRDAPPEIIKAAYRALSQKYHPDRNPDVPEATRIMTILNASYAVLSDPASRLAYDSYLERSENRTADFTPPQSPPPGPSAAPQPAAPRPAPVNRPPSAAPATSSSNGGIWGAVLMIVLFGAYLIAQSLRQSTESRGYEADTTTSTYYSTGQDLMEPLPEDTTMMMDTTRMDLPSEQETGYTTLQPTPTVWVRPDQAPNGSPWPQGADYVPDYEKLHQNGLSSVTVDNTRNDSDVFVKLVSTEGPEAIPVRVFYIPAYQAFTVEKVRAGTYDVRYQDLRTGGLSRSESFQLEETPTFNGTQYSTLRMTLYKVADGNMQTYPLAPRDF